MRKSYFLVTKNLLTPKSPFSVFYMTFKCLQSGSIDSGHLRWFPTAFAQYIRRDEVWVGNRREKAHPRLPPAKTQPCSASATWLSIDRAPQTNVRQVTWPLDPMFISDRITHGHLFCNAPRKIVRVCVFNQSIRIAGDYLNENYVKC